jgi:hypothetical protein
MQHDRATKILQRFSGRGRLDEANMTRPALDIQAALDELQSRSDSEIEYETSCKWAARAIAAYTLASRAPEPAEQILRFSQGDDARHESYEHGAQVEDGGKLIRYLAGQIETIREECLRTISKVGQ